MSALDVRITPTGVTVPNDAERALDAGAFVPLGSRRGQGGRGRATFRGLAALMTDVTVVQMAAHGRGLVSTALDPAAFRFGLRWMSGRRSAPLHSGEYSVSSEAAACRGTGVSAHDRALTPRTAGAPDADQNDLATSGLATPGLATPGHVVPVPVSGRLAPGSTSPEFAHATVARNTGHDVAAWCDVLDDDGDVADLDCGLGIAERLGLPAVITDTAPVLGHESDRPGRDLRGRTAGLSSASSPME